MNAQEVIENIKRLSPEERKLVTDYVRSLKLKEPVQYMDKETFEAAKTWVFNQHSELLKKLN